MDVPEKRRIEIKKQLEKNQSLSVANLARIFNVSEITIRRDLARLQDRGFLEKVHGGAIAKVSKEEYLPVYLDDIKLHREEKIRIAKSAAELISDGDSIIIESGTTCLELVNNIRNKKNLVIFTASVPLAYELWKISLNRSDLEVNICGGLIESKSNTLIGSQAVQFFNNISAKLAFIGAIAISADEGYVVTSSQMDADVTRAIVNSSRRRILIADSSKFSKTAHIKVFPLTVLEMVITDSKLDKKILNKLKRTGVKIILA